jgi:siroheme decarboxylase
MSAVSESVRAQLLEREKLLLTLLQDRFPLAARPFALLGQQLGCAEGEALDRVRALKEAGVVRQIGAIFDTRRLGYTSALVACEVESEWVDAVAAEISRHPGVSHNYGRDHRFNLWFTLGLPPGRDLEAEATRLVAQPGVRRTLLLPMVRAFKIDVRFDFGAAAEPAPAGSESPDALDGPLSPEDVLRVRALQNDLPLLVEPFAALGAPFGLDTVDLLGATERFRRTGLMRRYGATLRHRAAGFAANAMACWEVPAERIREAGEAAAAYPAVSHCYERPAYPPDWPFGLFTMLHARTDAALDACIADLHRSIRPVGLAILHTLKEYKKARLRYFDES